MKKCALQLRTLCYILFIKAVSFWIPILAMSHFIYENLILYAWFLFGVIRVQPDKISLVHRSHILYKVKNKKKKYNNLMKHYIFLFCLFV